MSPEVNWVTDPVASIDSAALKAATNRQASLTKPPGALGQLEQLAIKLASLQAQTCPTLERVNIAVFAADHGVTEAGISAFPQSVTLEMVKNFSTGGAAINVLARSLGATLEVINVGTVTDHDDLPGVFKSRVAAGTNNFQHGPAMDEKQITEAMGLGRQAVTRAVEKDAQLFIGGEMGIGNTTSASAVACVLLNLPAKEIVGPGTGLDNKGISQKISLVDAAIKLHRDNMQQPLHVLRHVGGLEIAALTGAYISSAQHGLPVLVDGFICSVAALCAVRLNPDVNQWLLYSHQSAEPGHQKILAALDAEPLLNLGMRLGEGSGAAMAVPILRMACELHGQMATFEQASVSEKN